jgi:hypothetical protein
MKKLFYRIILLTLVLNIYNCSTDSDSSENPNNNDDYFIKMFTGINRIGYETITNDNSIYIRGNSETFLTEFININDSGNTTTTDVTSVFTNYGISESFILYDFNNQINLVFIEDVNTSQANINLVIFDYDGNLINQQVLESNTSYSSLRSYENGFLAFNEVFDLQKHTVYYKIFNQSGNSINSQAIDISDGNPFIDDVFFENNNTYIIGKSNFVQGQGYTNQICRVYDSNGQLTNNNSFDLIDNSNDKLRVLNNRIHHSYNSGLGTQMEVYSVDGNLLNSTTLNQVLHFNYNSLGQFIYVGYNNTLNKNLDFKILDSQLESEIYSRNFGANNSSGSTGTAWVFWIKETENFYNIFGQTTAPKNGDFNLPENSSSFDDYLARFNKN